MSSPANSSKHQENTASILHKALPKKSKGKKHFPIHSMMSSYPDSTTNKYITIKDTDQYVLKIQMQKSSTEY